MIRYEYVKYLADHGRYEPAMAASLEAYNDLSRDLAVVSQDQSLRSSSIKGSMSTFAKRVRPLLNRMREIELRERAEKFLRYVSSIEQNQCGERNESILGKRDATNIDSREGLTATKSVKPSGLYAMERDADSEKENKRSLPDVSVET